MSVRINLIQRKSVRERVWKTLNVVVGISTILNVSMVGALVAPQAANATSGPTWPTDQQWKAPVCNDDPANDESPSWVDLKASGSEYGAAYYTDGTNLYLRERVDADPVSGSPSDSGYWNEHAWVFIIQKDIAVSQYDYLVSLRGSGSGQNVELWKNTTKSGPIAFSPLFNDPAELQLQTWTTIDHARRTTVGSDYYVDWQIPLSAIPDVNLLTSGLFFATSADANNYNKDHLDCYNAPQLQLNKELRKNGTGNWVADARTVPFTAAPGDTINYRVTVTNNGGPVNVPLTVTDELGRGGIADGSANVNPSTQYSNWTSTMNLNSDGAGNSFTGAWGNGTADGQNNDTLTVTLPGLAGGGVSEQFTFDAVVRNDLAVGTYLLENTATTMNLPSQTLLEAETDIQVIRTGQCNLVVTKTVDKTTANPGDILTYTINYVNNGTAFCTGGGVELYDQFNSSNATANHGLTFQNNSGDATIVVTNDQDLAPGDPAAQLYPTTFTGGSDKHLGNLHEIGPGESGVITLKVKVQNPQTSCQTWDVWNSGWTDGDQAASDVQFASPHTTITTPCATTLTLVKTVTNDNGGTKVVADFPLALNGSTVTSGVATAVTPGVLYTATETNNPAFGYAASVWGGDCAANGTITLTAGQNKTCTITNNDIQPMLTVTKVVINDNGGTKVIADFPLFVNQTSVTSGVQNGFNAGAYTVSETNQAGYSSTITGDCAANGTITLNPGSVKSCTITNNDVQPKLTVTKVVINDNGGTKVIADFPLFVNQTGVTSGVQNGFNAGAYTVSETNLPGYAATISGDCSANGSVTLAIGQTKSCTITNNDIQPKLTVTKVVINDNGGTKVVSDFSLFVDQAAVTSGVQNSINAGSYTVHENQVTGYTGVISGDCAVNGAITLNPGDVKACTITNNDVQPTLTVIKNVINDFGGVAVSSDFTMNVSGTNVSSPSFPGSSTGTNVTLNQGAYAVSETSFPGYSPVYSADCTGTISVGQSKTCVVTNSAQAPHLMVIKHVINDNGGTKVAADFTMNVTGGHVSPNGFPGNESGTLTILDRGAYSVHETGPAGYAKTLSADCSGTIELGQTKICTITNNDVNASLTVIKHVINDHNGTKVAGDFTMNVSGGNVQPSSSFPGSEQGVTVGLDAGSYSVDETGPVGYAKSLSQDCVGTLTNGQHKTCTITNDDIQPKLTVIKVVINDNGGTKVVADFPLFVDLSQVTSGIQNGFDAGLHLISEVGDAGYSASFSGDCDLQGTVTLNPGDVKSCTITNDDIQPKLTVTKVVINDNGGTKVVSDFPLFVDQTAVTSGIQNGFNADSYNVSEIGSFGYTATISGDCATNGDITLNPGDVKSCTITNDDVPPTITLIKNVINNNGGTASANDFGLTIGGTSVTSGQTLPVMANTAIALNEGGKAGYAFVSMTEQQSNEDRVQLCPNVLGGTVSLLPGQNITCIITNDDIQPKLTVTKVVINDNGGTKVVSDFPLFVNAGSVVSGVQNGFNAGAYTVSETNLPGYAATISGDCAANGTVTLGVGDTKSCTITNDDIIPVLGITKTNDIIGFTNPGKQVTYTIIVTNSASATDVAHNVVINDTLPAGFTFADTGLATKSTNASDIGIGVSKVFTYLVNIAAAQTAGIYTNTATAQGSNTLLVTATSNVDVRVPSVLGITIQPTLVLTKTVDTKVTNPGKTVTYTVTINNSGDQDVTNVRLSDKLPKGFVFADSGKDTKTWDIGTLKAHHQRVINYPVKVTDGVKAGKYDNLATVLSNELVPITAKASVEVKVPVVLGLATTGPSVSDYLLFSFGFSLMSLGFYWVARLRRQANGTKLA